MGYTYKDGICPFWLWDELKRVHCEAGRVDFPDADAAKGYILTYCAGPEWRGCTLCKMLYDHYEKGSVTK